MRAAPVNQAADVKIRRGMFADARFIDELHGLAIAVRRVFRIFGFQRVHLFVVERDCRRAAHIVAFDVVFLDARFDDLIAEIAGLPEEFLGLRAHLFDEFAFAGPAGEHLSAVAARRAPADAVRFGDSDGEAAIGERERRGDAGEAAADDGDVDFHVAGERRAFGRLMRRLLVVGFGMRVLGHAAQNACR